MPNRRSGHQPRGAILAAVIVCLMVVMLLGGAIVQNLVLHQRQARTEQQRLQAFWFAESALGRALAALSANSDYEGGEWYVQVSAADDVESAVAQIHVESDPRSPRRRRIRVVVRWPDDPIHRSVHQLEHVTFVPDSGDSP